MPESYRDKLRRVIENVFYQRGMWPNTSSPQPEVSGPYPAPWQGSRSLALRNYRVPPRGAVSLALGLTSYPQPAAIESFMLEGASDDEIYSRFPSVPDFTMKNARQSVNRQLQQLNRRKR